MPTRRPLSPKPKGKDEESAADETTSSPFRNLTKDLLTVPLDKVKTEEARQKQARKAERKRKREKR